MVCRSALEAMLFFDRTQLPFFNYFLFIFINKGINSLILLFIKIMKKKNYSEKVLLLLFEKNPFFPPWQVASCHVTTFFLLLTRQIKK